MKSWDRPHIVYPVLNIVRILKEAVEIDIAVGQGEIQDFADITGLVKYRLAFVGKTDRRTYSLNWIGERNDAIRTTLLDSFH